jgi:hypothetical protein
MKTKERTIKVPENLLIDLIGPIHLDATEMYATAEHHRQINQHDMAKNCEHLAQEKAGIANQARKLLGLPPMTYP